MLQQTLKQYAQGLPIYDRRRKRATLRGWTVTRRDDSRIECSRQTIFYHHEDLHWKNTLFQPRVEKAFFKNLAVEMKFQTLAQEWKRESRFASTANQMFFLPSYQKIIGLGPDAIPSILRDLQNESNHWFWALAALSDENPVQPQDAGNVRKMRQVWLDWGTQRGLL